MVFDGLTLNTQDLVFEGATGTSAWGTLFSWDANHLPASARAALQPGRSFFLGWPATCYPEATRQRDTDEVLVASHSEIHAQDRLAWLRAAVLGANDGIVSTSSLMIGVVAAGQSASATLVAGVAGLVAGAMSMAAGEFVSVASQRDAEDADIAKETRELAETPASELDELIAIYKHRGLDEALARAVAEKFTAHDALQAHLRDELGITDLTRAKPFQAAWVSAVSFVLGAALPILVSLITPANMAVWAIGASAALALGGSGYVGAKLGGANPQLGAVRVGLGGIAAMSLTFGIGHLLGITVG